MDMKLVTFLVKLILLELEVSEAIDILFIALLIIFFSNNSCFCFSIFEFNILVGLLSNRSFNVWIFYLNNLLVVREVLSALAVFSTILKKIALLTSHITIK